MFIIKSKTIYYSLLLEISTLITSFLKRYKAKNMPIEPKERREIAV
jgi:hypothetical protein